MKSLSVRHAPRGSRSRLLATSPADRPRARATNTASRGRRSSASRRVSPSRAMTACHHHPPICPGRRPTSGGPMCFCRRSTASRITASSATGVYGPFGSKSWLPPRPRSRWTHPSCWCSMPSTSAARPRPDIVAADKKAGEAQGGWNLGEPTTIQGGAQEKPRGGSVKSKQTLFGAIWQIKHLWGQFYAPLGNLANQAYKNCT